MTEKMDPCWKEKWVDALRSGEYKQGRGQLRNDDGTYCCLGVLADLTRREEAVGGTWSAAHNVSGYAYMGRDGRVTRGVLPPEVRDAVGLKASNPEVGDPDSVDRLYGTLSDHNDTGSTFPEIADLIEEYL